MSPQTHISCLILLLTLRVCQFDKKLQRQKRFLYYPLGGSFKMVLGFAIPVQLGYKQTMGWGFNIQFQYAVPLTTNNTRIYPPIVSRGREKRHNIIGDRALAYAGIETIFNRHGFEGRACLLRSICENALQSLHHSANGLYGQILHIFLTPDYGDGEIDPDLDPVYLEAEKAGRFGVDCLSLYPECQEGQGILEWISLLS